MACAKRVAPGARAGRAPGRLELRLIYANMPPLRKRPGRAGFGLAAFKLSIVGTSAATRRGRPGLDETGPARCGSVCDTRERPRKR